MPLPAHLLLLKRERPCGLELFPKNELHDEVGLSESKQTKKSATVKKIIKWIGIVFAIVFIGIQFLRPDRTNPPVDENRTLYARVPVPPEIKTMIERSCSDCHSSNTRWPWYSNIAPVSWLVADDVQEARKHLNLSDFAQYPPLRALAKLDMMCENMQDGLMPLPKYVAMHPDAKLSKEEIDRFCSWVDSVADTLANSE